MKLVRQSNEDPTRTWAHRVAGSIGVAVLLMTGIAGAQGAATSASVPQAPQPMVQRGFVVHQSADLGGHVAGIFGSGAMYDTLVNLHSGPRVLGQTFTLYAVPGSKHPLLDQLSAFTTGFGGDPYNFVKLDVSKGKLYEFAGTFRRDRQYFDYDLLGNPNIPAGYSTPISGSTTPLASPQVLQSPFMFNTVRRMTDTYLTLFPLSKVTLRFAYSQNTFEGPSQSPSGNSVAGQEVILQEYQRNSTDDFTGAVDWKPVLGTRFTFEEQVDHYKGDSFFTMAPQYFTVQEADGTKVALLHSYQNSLPYGYASSGVPSRTANCSSALGSSILTANPTGGLPIIDPACYVISSYFRSQPTREIFPTEIFRMQSSSIRNVAMNGDLRYTKANMNMPNYYENFQGLSTTTRSTAYTAYAHAQRRVIAADYGITWQATGTISFSDQINFSNVHQPGTAEFTSGTTEKIASGTDTINNPALSVTRVTTGAAPFGGGPAIGSELPGYFGQRFVVNNATVSWDQSARATFSLTYRYRTHTIVQDAASGPDSSVIKINENGGIFYVALRPSNNWNINGSAQLLYNDNVLTPVDPRQTQHYRVHTVYRPKQWATVSAAYNDLEQRNNTNNTGIPSAVGPLNHINHTRIVSLGADLMPNQHYGLDFNYAYNDVYTSTNACIQSAASFLPGGAVDPGVATPTGSLCAPIAAGHGANNVLAGPVKDFEDAPTQYGSVALALITGPRFHSDLGYRISSVNGTRLFTDSRDVNGSLVSAYQTPFVSVAWTVHPGLIWKGEYDYYSYGEGGASGAEYCNANVAAPIGSASVTAVPCSTLPNTARSGPAYGATAPRNFHANLLTLSMHYEF
ncbi:MAG: hypothetical protein M3Y72_11810 [Acidobacteriota bacterium]|nr:hypothetical protein [Acidobacteriota bacterium]